MDMKHRYVPRDFITKDGWAHVGTWIAHPPGGHKDSPIRNEMGAVECILVNGHWRWFGCERAYIKSELRMVIVGTNPKDEVRMAWKIVPKDLTA